MTMKTIAFIPQCARRIPSKSNAIQVSNHGISTNKNRKTGIKIGKPILLPILAMRAGPECATSRQRCRELRQ